MPSTGTTRLAALAIAFAVMLPTTRAPAVGAQTATATPNATDAAACTVQPRAFADIADLASTPTASATSVPGDGGPAGSEVVAAVTETIRMAVACANANDPLRSFALFTDRYLAERFGSAHPDDLGSLYAALSRQPTPAKEGDLLSLVEVRNVMMPAKNLVVGTVVTENRSARYVDRLVFQRIGDRWLIDQWSPAEGGATPTA
jgi:hypothetical protein